MKARLLLFVFLGAVLRGQVVPGLYIAELAPLPKEGGRTAAVEKAGVRLALQQRNAEVVASVDRVMNALVVRIDDSRRAELAATPGIAKVYPVYEAHLVLDRALPLHKVPEAWQRSGGMQQAGLGIRIGIIDTGIDATHPAFQDATLTLPDGFPRGNRDSDLEGTNNKIIVARSYENLLGSLPSTRDVNGHGTSVAMVAAGMPSQAPLALITGVAPRAFLGSYKVFTGSGAATSRTDVILRALDDAVADGMDVINMSLTVSPAPPPSEDALLIGVEAAGRAGVLVVTAVGNDGPDPGTAGSPAGAFNSIAAGASQNDRLFGTAAVIGTVSYAGVPAQEALPPDPVSGVLVDVASLDESGRTCAALPGDSLTGKIALILRGGCTFEEKLNFAKTAGAIAALVYTNDQAVAVMSVGPATLPAMMVSNEDGLRIRGRLAETPGLQASLGFNAVPFAISPDFVASFSSRGPTSSRGIVPDVAAIGLGVYTAAERNTPAGEIYNASGYALVNGTSYSSPMVAGAAALVKGARPGLTVELYRSLLINSAAPLVSSGQIAGPQSAGAGLLNVDAALRSTLAAFPTSISFGGGMGSVDAAREITFRNLGQADTYSIVAEPIGSGPAPSLSESSIALDSGASATTTLRWNPAELPPGTYQGIIRVHGALSDVDQRIPYWYAALSPQPGLIKLVNPPSSARVNGLVTLMFRVMDASGVIRTDFIPEITFTEGGGRLVVLNSIENQYPGMWQATLRMGPNAGTQAFEIKAGEAVRNVAIPVN